MLFKKYKIACELFRKNIFKLFIIFEISDIILLNSVILFVKNKFLAEFLVLLNV